MTHQTWRTLAEFNPLPNGTLRERLTEATRELHCPEVFLKRLGETVSNAVQAARQRGGTTEVKVRLLVSPGYVSGEQPHCGWGFFRLERVVEQPNRQTEIEVFLFPEG